MAITIDQITALLPSGLNLPTSTSVNGNFRIGTPKEMHSKEMTTEQRAQYFGAICSIANGVADILGGWDHVRIHTFNKGKDGRVYPDIHMWINVSEANGVPRSRAPRQASVEQQLADAVTAYVTGGGSVAQLATLPEDNALRLGILRAWTAGDSAPADSTAPADGEVVVVSTSSEDIPF